MADMILKKSDLTEFIKSLTDGGQVLAPVQDGRKVKFAPVIDDGFLLDYKNTHLSPKNLFFPQSERMFWFTTNHNDPKAQILQEVPDQVTSRVIFGLRPCDAKAFAVLDRIFQNDQYTDPYWQKKREASTLIGLACNKPCATCFCTSMNCGPFHQAGLDVLAVDLGEELLLKTVTARGEDLLARARGLNPSQGRADEQAAALKATAEEAVTSQVLTDRIFQRTVLELFEAPHWEQVHESCLNCGTCTYFCPTCHCFDIQDEVAGTEGDRVRNWDTCMSWLFTMHGSGHNPRPGGKDRVRQRFMHKFKYIPMKRDGEIGCVGCGRCVVQCPVNIDVREVVTNMNS